MTGNDFSAATLRSHSHSHCALNSPPTLAEEAERVASYDFDAAMSPRASYHVRDAPFQPHATPELVFRWDWVAGTW